MFEKQFEESELNNFFEMKERYNGFVLTHFSVICKTRGELFTKQNWGLYSAPIFAFQDLCEELKEHKSGHAEFTDNFSFEAIYSL